MDNLKHECIAIVQHHVECAELGMPNSLLFIDNLNRLYITYNTGQPPDGESVRIVSAIVLGTALALGFTDIQERLIDYVGGVMAIYQILLDMGDDGDETLQ